MHRQKRQVDLYLDGKDVGHVDVQRLTLAWGFGNFTPNAEFARFAPRFGLWSMLMHEDDSADSVNQFVREELRHAEQQIDQLHAELLWPDTGQRTRIRQLNIDGSMIEWRR